MFVYILYQVIHTNHMSNWLIFHSHWKLQNSRAEVAVVARQMMSLDASSKVMVPGYKQPCWWHVGANQTSPDTHQMLLWLVNVLRGGTVSMVLRDPSTMLSYRLCSGLFTGHMAKVKVKVGFLYSASYTANQNSALHNLGSGSWLAIASGAAALCGLSTARANGHWTRGCSQRTHHRPNQPLQAFTLVSFRKVSPPAEIADTRLLLTTHLSTPKGWKAELA